MSEYASLILALLLVALWVKPLGGYMTAVYLGLPHPLSRLFGALERALYRLCGIDANTGMSWRSYALCVLLTGALGIVFLTALFMAQGALPMNPQGIAGMSLHLAFSTAASFITNTNWQSYSPESQMSYLAQTAGVGVQMFVSAATGMAVAVAMCRALAAKNTRSIGNFWVDMLRSLLYILLPLSFVFGVILVSQGVVQNYAPYVTITTLEGAASSIAQGPAALQTAIKMLGSNGGGFFTANAAHPYENPNAITNILQLTAILLLPVTFVYMAGLLMRDRRQGLMMMTSMALLFLPLLLLALTQEHTPSPKFDPQVVDISDGNMEGKETRFGLTSSSLWSVLTTATSNGSTNAAHDSFSPLSNLVQLVLMQLGEVVFGGVGSGVYGMLVFVFMTTFIAGLMVGRTPEFLGKKLTPFDIKMVALALLIPSLFTLGGTALAVATEAGRIAISNPGPHGFSQVLYGFTSATHNNGSALGGLQATSPFYTFAFAVCMLVGRYSVILCILALAGSFAHKNTTPVTAGTLPTHTPLFTLMLTMVVILLGVLTYVPALALGPVADYLMLAGAR